MTSTIRLPSKFLHSQHIVLRFCHYHLQTTIMWNEERPMTIIVGWCRRCSLVHKVSIFSEKNGNSRKCALPWGPEPLNLHHLSCIPYLSVFSLCFHIATKVDTCLKWLLFMFAMKNNSYAWTLKVGWSTNMDGEAMFNCREIWSHAPLKYRCSFKISYRIRSTYHM